MLYKKHKKDINKYFEYFKNKNSRLETAVFLYIFPLFTNSIHINFFIYKLRNIISAHTKRDVF